MHDAVQCRGQENTEGGYEHQTGVQSIDAHKPMSNVCNGPFDQTEAGQEHGGVQEGLVKRHFLKKHEPGNAHYQ